VLFDSGAPERYGKNGHYAQQIKAENFCGGLMYLIVFETLCRQATLCRFELAAKTSAIYHTLCEINFLF
jgi:hypothetical protein